MTMISSNPIYGYRASEELGEDAWGGLVKATDFMDHAKASAAIKGWEKEYKNSVNLPIPSAWRSAKSVLLKAKKLGATIGGKTATEKACKAKEAGTAPPWSPREKFHNACLAAVKAGMARAEMMDVVNDIFA